MKAILTSLWCLPCVWALLGGLGLFGSVSYVMNTWIPLYGPLPSQGPVEFEGFTSGAARTEYYDTKALRVRTAGKVLVIGVIIWLAGLLTIFLILKYI
jgi:hypothetical protein